jgi:hypothetical protein
VLAATPSLTGHLDVVLSRCKELRDIKRQNICLQIGGGRKRHQMLQSAKEEASTSQMTTIVISAAELVHWKK